MRASDDPTPLLASGQEARPVTPLTTISLCVGAGAMALLLLGLRGRPLDDLQRCRACGYDVSGIQDACPECGRWLGGRRAIKRGARARRPIPLALALLLLLSLTLPGLWWWTGRESHASRPTWRLLIEARSETEPEAPALEELIARWDNAELSQDAIGELAAMVSRAWAAGHPGSALRRQTLFQRCLTNAAFSDDQLRLAFEGAMRDLSHDDVWGNAAQGERLIRTLGTPAIEQLPRYLHSEDEQQALRAARLLSRFDPGRHEARLTELAIRSLRHDQHQGNLGWAVGYLWSDAGADALAPLARAIHDPDAQLRVHAKEALARIHERTGRTPGEEVIRAWVEMLAAHAEGRSWTATRGLIAHASAGEPALRRAMAAGSDPQQRFLAAYILATSGLGGEDVVNLLIDHLGDNGISGDAARAAAALWRLGEPARPAVLIARDDPDPQRARHAREILWAWSLPEGTDHTYRHESVWRVTQLWFPESEAP
ncbi:MAG: hypothetical protein ACIARR_10095 [Phycisphaerales bacterium JB059]